MSGHSKWATIHRKKGLLDAARGKVFQKLAKEIMVAAKGGSPDPQQNAALRMAVDKAKAQNMPKDNIQKAIEKATGTTDGANYENVRYEGYGPNGIAVIVEALTDNKNRTAANVRSAFTKGNGNMGTSGCVSFMFDKKGQIIVDKEEYEGKQKTVINVKKCASIHDENYHGYDNKCKLIGNYAEYANYGECEKNEIN